MVPLLFLTIEKTQYNPIVPQIYVCTLWCSHKLPRLHAHHKPYNTSSHELKVEKSLKEGRCECNLKYKEPNCFI